jgi:hypothetical protein
MSFRSRLAHAARGLAAWLEAPSGKATAAPDPVLDLMDPAPVAYLPTASWTPLGERSAPAP